MLRRVAANGGRSNQQSNGHPAICHAQSSVADEIGKGCCIDLDAGHHPTAAGVDGLIAVFFLIFGVFEGPTEKHRLPLNGVPFRTQQD